jgi:type IV pilus assembly protein PilY1
MAKGGVAAAFARQQSNLRVGFGTINSTGTVVRAPVRFADAARTGFYTDLYGVVPSGGTPLRRALFDVGEYFKRTGASSPWKEDANDSSPYTCRRSFHILSTDGFWNGADASTPANANHDTLSGNTPEKPDKTAYKYRDDAPTGGADPLVERFTISPFQDNVATTKTTLADVAAYYWRTDLQPGLDNEVASSTRDPAYWQHLSTYPVGLGVAGTGEVKRKSDGLAAVPAAEPASSPFSSDDFENKPWLATQRMRSVARVRGAGTATLGEPVRRLPKWRSAA